MDRFIQIRNGQPFEHPIMGDNFRQAFPHIDVNNLPPEFARFERVDQPIPKIFEVVDGVKYEWVDGIVKDVWQFRPMTEEEKQHEIVSLIGGANNVLNWRKGITQQKIDTAPNLEIKQIWADYLAELNAWVIVDPVYPNIPIAPILSQNGTVLTTEAPGSNPDVFV